MKPKKLKNETLFGSKKTNKVKHDLKKFKQITINWETS